MMLNHIEPRKARRPCLSYFVFPIFHTYASNLVLDTFRVREYIHVMNVLRDLMRCSSQNLHDMVLFAFWQTWYATQYQIRCMISTNDVFRQNNNNVVLSRFPLRKTTCVVSSSFRCAARRGQMSFLEASRFAQEKEQ